MSKNDIYTLYDWYITSVKDEQAVVLVGLRFGAVWQTTRVVAWYKRNGTYIAKTEAGSLVLCDPTNRKPGVWQHQFWDSRPEIAKSLYEIGVIDQSYTWDGSDITSPADPIIVAVSMTGDACTSVRVKFEGSDEYVELFSFFNDEISIMPSELLGLTRRQACDLHTRRDVAYLKS